MLLQIQRNQETGASADDNDQQKQERNHHIITLDGKAIHNSEEADYLGMLINIRHGFICKDPKEFLSKGKSVAAMLSPEKWFSLIIHPKNIANLYQTHVRSLVLYGSELLSEAEQKPLEQVDDEQVRTFLKGLLKLKSIKLHKKHTKRLLLIFQIPTVRM